MRGRRRIFVAAGTGIAVLFVVGALAGGRSRPTPGVATEAELVAFVDADRARAVASAPVPKIEDPGPVAELPARAAVGFVSPRREVTWYALGGRFSPAGVLTPPRADVPFLFPVMESSDVRLVLQAVPVANLPAVPNAVDLPPVVLSRGEDRTVWSGGLARAGDRFLRPESVGAARRGIVAVAGEPSPRYGRIAPETLPRDALPPSGVLLGRTTLHRLRRSESLFWARPSRAGALLARIGLPSGAFGRDEGRGRTVHYEARTLLHVYRRHGDGWRYAHSRVRTATAQAVEGDDRAAFLRFGMSPAPSAGRGAITTDRTLRDADRPGASFLPYRSDR